jgi:hypothetical protein
MRKSRPKTKKKSTAYKNLINLQLPILNGKALIIDPSSGSHSSTDRSNCGWAELEYGRVVDSGIIKLDHGKQPFQRLRLLGECLREDFADDYDILVLEFLEGDYVSPMLIKACGAIMANIKSKHYAEINIKTWQAIARRLGGWVKGDEHDAKYMGYAAVALALGYRYNPKPCEKNEEALRRVVELQGGAL